MVLWNRVITMKKTKPLVFPYPKKKYTRTNELLEEGYSYYMINRMEAEGMIRRINGHTYENLSYVGDDHDFLYVSGYVNEGVICLMSAAVYHGLSTFRPNRIETAIRQKSRVTTLPSWPKIALHYFSKQRYELGITKVECEGGSFMIYDKEKTVCDMITYRNKYGLEDSLDVLRHYLSKEDRDINRLVSYAKKLRSYHILSKYLEVLL